MKIGITGHQHFSDAAATEWVHASIETQLRDRRPLIGISCLAVGADQVFAECVLALGGTLEVILPFEGYEKTLEVKERGQFATLLGAATRVVVLGGQRDNEEAYFAAGKKVVEESELIVAVWNHLPAEGKGGTADVVAYAASLRRPIICIDPVARTITEV